MVNVTLEPLTIQYVSLLRTWRNENRKFFINQQIITAEMQKTWFATYQKNKNDRIFLVFYDSIPVGCISVIHRKNEIEIGRVMLGEKNYARKGIMGQALEQIVTANKNKKIFIEVLKNNIAGVNFYKKHGFAIIQNTEECYRMERK